ncbi:anthranilate phosphoribosyltransferase [Serpentinicella sp. ANB-PHB4]|uniref:anthranilate phosphoribosyltransferase n=1 Tax=Serpentinicella sp. ANB-PHB4 TaxID=3074076 RepID=UPI002861E694|nr:anthranilate phosphoribosyltransferase [Serpentinicella sp. ANB-PHB4]MDR5659155.1 anthranilate phosphoribosyltransferase [Serpentinicella sp. ANB-PHB4]
MLHELTIKLMRGYDLSGKEMYAALEEILSKNANQVIAGAFLTALAIKGATVDEITSGTKFLRNNCLQVHLDYPFTLDTCGTGGDGSNTYNISTAVAFVAAAAGVIVVKHGNRSISSKSGSADVLEKLGVNLSQSPEEIKVSLQKHGISFLFAPLFHKTMKNIGTVRKELGFRTIFNILGPLSNPASTKGQVLGVFDAKLTEPLAKVLHNLGVRRALVVYGMDGMDEITVTTKTKVTELNNGVVSTYYISPEDYGISPCSSTELLGGDASHNANIIKNLFRGASGPKRDILVLNSAAALYVAGKCPTIKEGVHYAKNLLDSGLVYNKFIQFTNKGDDSIVS